MVVETNGIKPDFIDWYVNSGLDKVKHAIPKSHFEGFQKTNIEALCGVRNHFWHQSDNHKVVFCSECVIRCSYGFGVNELIATYFDLLDAVAVLKSEGYSEAATILEGYFALRFLSRRLP